MIIVYSDNLNMFWSLFSILFRRSTVNKKRSLSAVSTFISSLLTMLHVPYCPMHPLCRSIQICHHLSPLYRLDTLIRNDDANTTANAKVIVASANETGSVPDSFMMFIFSNFGNFAALFALI